MSAKAWAKVFEMATSKTSVLHMSSKEQIANEMYPILAAQLTDLRETRIKLLNTIEQQAAEIARLKVHEHIAPEWDAKDAEIERLRIRLNSMTLAYEGELDVCTDTNAQLARAEAVLWECANQDPLAAKRYFDSKDAALKESGK